MLQRIIPSSGEELPVIGLGTWRTFDINTEKKLKPLSEVLQTMQEAGGRLIDSSPMYGHAEKVIGELTADPARSNYFFYATKIWTTGKEAGIQQMEESFQKMKRNTMDLVQVHNLTDWKTHLETLNEWKAAGRIRYTGITHYTDAYHEELEQILSSERIDFVQFNYSLFDRNAEKRLLDIAAEKGIAVLINRPFGEGSAFAKIKHLPIPLWAAQYNINTWSQFFLLFIISHPAVTAVIPATGNPLHAAENFKIASPDLPMGEIRKKMIAYAESL